MFIQITLVPKERLGVGRGAAIMADFFAYLPYDFLCEFCSAMANSITPSTALFHPYDLLTCSKYYRRSAADFSTSNVGVLRIFTQNQPDLPIIYNLIILLKNNLFYILKLIFNN